VLITCLARDKTQNRKRENEKLENQKPKRENQKNKHRVLLLSSHISLCATLCRGCPVAVFVMSVRETRSKVA
jgi:hypothetical protein